MTPKKQVQVPMRSDARERREALLRAAQQVIVESGVGAPLEEIASRAGVGRGTFYRNFPDRLALYDALLEREIEHLEDASRKVVNRADGFFILFTEMAHGMLLTAVLVEELNRSDYRQAVKLARNNRFLALFEAPMRRAQSAGTLRRDFRIEDVLHLGMMMVRSVQGLSVQERKQRLLRAVELVFEGLKTR